MMTMQELCDRLSLSGANFVRDVWVKQPTVDYGTVEIASERVQWANNHPHRRQVTYTISLYTYGPGDACAHTVEGILSGLPKLRTWRPAGTGFVDGTELTRHAWTVVLEGVIPRG